MEGEQTALLDRACDGGDGYTCFEQGKTRSEEKHLDLARSSYEKGCALLWAGACHNLACKLGDSTERERPLLRALTASMCGSEAAFRTMQHALADWTRGCASPDVQQRRNGCALAGCGVQRPREPDAEALHPARQAGAVVRLDDQMQVIAQHRELDQPQTVILPRLREALTNQRKPARAAQ
jgi:hypothetical protein